MSNYSGFLTEKKINKLLYEFPSTETVFVKVIKKNKNRK